MERTKGDWYTEFAEHSLILSIPDGEDTPVEIAVVNSELKEGKANAYLIAAAPIGYELATAILAQRADGMDRGKYIYQKAWDFMVKAKGE